jgi:hypothetical protein
MVSLDDYLEKLTRKQLEVAVGVLALDKGVDLVTGGRLNKLTKKVLMATGRRLLPIAGRAGISVAGTALGATRLLMANPYILGGTAIYVGYQERDKIRSLLEQGYEIIEERLPTPAPPSIPDARPTLPGLSEPITVRGMAARPASEFLGAPRIPKGFDPMTMIRRPRRPSAFNRAVSAGMKAVKKSTRYGGKGKIRPAKKVFAMVTKLAAAKKKKKKAPKSGIRRKIWTAMKRYL